MTTVYPDPDKYPKDIYDVKQWVMVNRRAFERLWKTE